MYLCEKCGVHYAFYYSFDFVCKDAPCNFNKQNKSVEIILIGLLILIMKKNVIRVAMKRFFCILHVNNALTSFFIKLLSVHINLFAQPVKITNLYCVLKMVWH